MAVWYCAECERYIYARGINGTSATVTAMANHGRRSHVKFAEMTDLDLALYQRSQRWPPS